MFTKLFVFFSNPANILLLGLMLVSGLLFLRGHAYSHKLGISCEDLPTYLNQRKNKGLMLHQADDTRLQVKSLDDEQNNKNMPYLRGIANTSHIIIEAGELTGDAFKGLLIKIEKAAKKSNPLVLIDQDARMAKHLAKKLAKEGWNVVFLEGGLNAWVSKNLPSINIYNELKVLLQNKKIKNKSSTSTVK
jgi:rhodanese-related sulfurtransferase